jgi:leader peptidase (prepilin peptidase)/N-methyltransferase
MQMEYLLIFITGVCVGSFLNVCIHRIPVGQSIVTPRSFCPYCGVSLKWFDNIPLISFIVLKGKCRRCSHKISVKYPLVELATALAGLLLYKWFELTPQFFVYWVFVMLLLVVSVIDIEKQIIPDIISLGGIVAGLTGFTVFRLEGAANFFGAFLFSLSGASIGFLLMLALALAGQYIFKKEAMGGGDIKLVAMIGAFLGWKKVLLTFFIAPFLGSFTGLYLKIRYKREIVPYGPYLALGALISLLYGDAIIKCLFNY